MRLRPRPGERPPHHHARRGGGEAANNRNQLHLLEAATSQPMLEEGARPTYHNVLCVSMYINPDQTMYYLANPQSGKKVRCHASRQATVARKQDVREGFRRGGEVSGEEMRWLTRLCGPNPNPNSPIHQHQGFTLRARPLLEPGASEFFSANRHGARSVRVLKGAQGQCCVSFAVERRAPKALWALKGLAEALKDCRSR